jgi:hypothetical protein
MQQDTTSAMGLAAAPRKAEGGEPAPPVSLTGDWAPRADKIGICCSGGGVRSASFNLGALQALQAAGVLGKAEYLSSVSGGGYTAAAMTMVAGSGADRVFAEGCPEPFAPGSPEEAYLRNRSSYLAPGTTGKLRLVANVLRGLLFNALVVGSLLVGAGVALGLVTMGVDLPADHDLGDALRAGRWWAAGVLGGLIVSLLLYRGFTRARSAWWEDLELLLMRWAWRGALGVLAVLVAGPWLVNALDRAGETGAWLADAVDAVLPGTPSSGTSGTSSLATVLGIVSALGVPALLAGAARTVFKGAGAVIGRIVVWLVVPLLAATVVLLVAVGWQNGVSPTDRGILALAVAVAAGAFGLADINAGSMHRFYKRRLCTAFALERVWRDAQGTVHRDTKPDGATLDASEREYDDLVRLSDAARGDVGNGHWPTWIACAAANIGTETVTPPGRNAVTFTFDPEWIGGPQVGYVPTRTYEQVLGDVRGEDVTIPAALAISGAALSPCMGAMTKPYLRMLLTLVNARLGVWLPSPNWIRESRGGAAALRPTFRALFKEMNGANRHDAGFLYVTDGGHWENLGLVELLRRGCTTIYCIDASGDQEETFFTIGQAVSMARSELGVEITVRPDDMRPDPDDPGAYSKADHVIGTLKFTRVPEGGAPVRGRIAFIKAQVTRDAPWDVRAYKEKDPEFPNHSLLEQMFADQTFEAYRALGHHAATGAVASMAQTVLPQDPPRPAVRKAPQRGA